MNKIEIEGIEKNKPLDRFALIRKIILLTIAFLFMIYTFFGVGMLGSNSFALYTKGQMKLLMIVLSILSIPYIYLIYKIKPLIQPSSCKTFTTFAIFYGAILLVFIVFA